VNRLDHENSDSEEFGAFLLQHLHRTVFGAGTAQINPHGGKRSARITERNFHRQPTEMVILFTPNPKKVGRNNRQ